jgi:uncharacterized membrane protein YukC
MDKDKQNEGVGIGAIIIIILLAALGLYILFSHYPSSRAKLKANPTAPTEAPVPPNPQQPRR